MSLSVQGAADDSQANFFIRNEILTEREGFPPRDEITFIMHVRSVLMRISGEYGSLRERRGAVLSASFGQMHWLLNCRAGCRRAPRFSRSHFGRPSLLIMQMAYQIVPSIIIAKFALLCPASCIRYWNSARRAVCYGKATDWLTSVGSRYLNLDRR